MKPVLPPRAVHAANRILVRLPATGWTPQDRDIAAAIIASECGETRAREACVSLLAAFPDGVQNGPGRIDSFKLGEACKLASLALRR